MGCVYCCSRVRVLEVQNGWRTVQCLNRACYVRYNERVEKEENKAREMNRSY